MQKYECKHICNASNCQIMRGRNRSCSCILKKNIKKVVNKYTDDLKLIVNRKLCVDGKYNRLQWQVLVFVYDCGGTSYSRIRMLNISILLMTKQVIWVFAKAVLAR